MKPILIGWSLVMVVWTIQYTRYLLWWEPTKPLTHIPSTTGLLRRIS